MKIEKIALLGAVAWAVYAAYQSNDTSTYTDYSRTKTTWNGFAVEYGMKEQSSLGVTSWGWYVRADQGGTLVLKAEGNANTTDGARAQIEAQLQQWLGAKA